MLLAGKLQEENDKKRKLWMMTLDKVRKILMQIFPKLNICFFILNLNSIFGPLALLIVIVSTPDRTNQWLSKLIWKPMKAMKLQTWWRPKVYEKETGLYFFPQFCKNNDRKLKTRILWEKVTFWLEEKKVINQAKFWYISISWQVFNWFFAARWKRENRKWLPRISPVFSWPIKCFFNV